MNSDVRIPQGDDTVKVELTVKEVMALAGVKFHNNHKIEVSAKRKLNHALEGQYHMENKHPIN
jgi:ssDNA-binding replication factor A large subunit